MLLFNSQADLRTMFALKQRFTRIDTEEMMARSQMLASLGRYR